MKKDIQRHQSILKFIFLQAQEVEMSIISVLVSVEW